MRVPLEKVLLEGRLLERRHLSHRRNNNSLERRYFENNWRPRAPASKITPPPRKKQIVVLSKNIVLENTQKRTSPSPDLPRGSLQSLPDPRNPGRTTPKSSESPTRFVRRSRSSRAVYGFSVSGRGAQVHRCPSWGHQGLPGALCACG